jgi:hypothetical protein
MHGRLRWLRRLPLVVSRHATVSTVPRVQGQGRPPGQATERGRTITEAAVNFASNLTDQPELVLVQAIFALFIARAAASDWTATSGMGRDGGGRT